MFSHRRNIELGNIPKEIQYDNLPDKLVIQIVHIWQEHIGLCHLDFGYVANAHPQRHPVWKKIEQIVAKEHGLVSLKSGSYRSITAFERCAGYLSSPDIDIEHKIDLLEVSFQKIENRTDQGRVQLSRHEHEAATAAIADLNERFRRAGVGYKYVNGRFVRVDSEWIESTVTHPAFKLLAAEGFSGANDEFFKAHRHYRQGLYKEAVLCAHNAFESTIKAICKSRGWKHKEHATVSDLVRVIKEKGLFPDYLSPSFDQLVAVLKSGLQVLRNNEGAHGQGVESKKTPDYVAGFTLHLSAAYIVFLINAHLNCES